MKPLTEREAFRANVPYEKVPEMGRQPVADLRKELTLFRFCKDCGRNLPADLDHKWNDCGIYG